MNIIVRAFVIALTLTGAVASFQPMNVATAKISHPKPSQFPTPMCPPSDPNACGIANRN